MHASGTAYLIKYELQELPDFIEDAQVINIPEVKISKPTPEMGNALHFRRSQG
jgi:hypothetical protein